MNINVPMLEEREARAEGKYLEIHESNRLGFTVSFVVVSGGRKDRNDDESSNGRVQFQQTCLKVTVQGGSSLHSISAQPSLSGTFQCSYSLKMRSPLGHASL